MDSALKFYLLDCDCISFQRVSWVGELDPQFGIYREPSDGPCEICMAKEGTWQDWVVDEMVVYNSQVRIEEI